VRRDGHEWATSITIEKLPDDVPVFVRDPAYFEGEFVKNNLRREALAATARSSARHTRC
jgi:hypothetical protein